MYMYVYLFCVVGEFYMYVLFVWSVYCVSCLSGLGVICLVCLGCLSFLPTSYTASVLYVHACISTYSTILYSLKNECFRRVVLCCFAFLLLHVRTCMYVDMFFYVEVPQWVWVSLVASLPWPNL